MSFAGSFRKAAAMDFYITKYQGKPMESLTPLFKSMTEGVIRLERQEEEEQAEAESARMALATETGGEPPPKQRKTKEDLLRRARRLTCRIASMANRCYWVSPAELPELPPVRAQGTGTRDACVPRGQAPLRKAPAPREGRTL